ncbi:MAG: SDR family NAD(P)-dependent oxidoreductase [Bacteroidales bacterium]|nr:SDR family NAD(P)-dependent oxidoreductase [Bacteroidales bacterium]
MIKVIVTGTSSGIGEAIALRLLHLPNAELIGVSRTQTIEHHRYTHKFIDLSDLEQVQLFQFPACENNDEIILINNSGVIGDIAPVGKKSDRAIIETFNINTIAPALLMNAFVNYYQNHTGLLKIINISSGAGRHPVASWADYCASKAAIDMFSEVIYEEQSGPNLKIISLAPGIVDTAMQTDIREADSALFPLSAHFKQLKHTGQLSSSSEVAKQIVDLITGQISWPDVISDVRDF